MSLTFNLTNAINEALGSNNFAVLEAAVPTMTVADMKEVCRNLKITGFSRLHKEALRDMILDRIRVRNVSDVTVVTAAADKVSQKEAKRAAKKAANKAKAEAARELSEVRNEALLTLEGDFEAAERFFAKLWKVKRNVKFYTELIPAWKVLRALAGPNGVDLCSDVVKTANAVSKIFGANAKFGSNDVEMASEFIQEKLNTFTTEAFRVNNHKDQVKVIKVEVCSATGFGSNNGLNLTDINGTKVLTFNSTVSGEEIATSEDGISRMLAADGKGLMTVYLETPEKYSEEDYYEFRSSLIKNGLYDEATMKRYFFVCRSASSTRQAQMTFTEANNWNEIQDYWLRFTGFSTWDDMVQSFGAETNLAKFIVRISSRSSNSFSVKKLSPEMDEIIRGFNVTYVNDLSLEVTSEHMTRVAPGQLAKSSSTRTLTPGDGQMLGSIYAHACVARGLGLLSKDEFDEFTYLWDKAGKDLNKVNPVHKLGSLIGRIPAVIQLRHGSKKGISVMCNLEAHEETADLQFVIPNSVRKFDDGDWKNHEFEVCAYLKRKDRFVNLNSEFLTNLYWENVEDAFPLVDRWTDFLESTLTDMAARQSFHHLMKNTDDADLDWETQDNAGKLEVICECEQLMDDKQVSKWTRQQYVKFLNNLCCGRIPVEGCYTYMVADPNYLLNEYFELDLDVLDKGQAYFNGNDCKAVAMRSPLISPFEAQKYDLVVPANYWIYNDTFVMNQLDGRWELMGGADYDGDICAVIPNNTQAGQIIWDGVEDDAPEIYTKGYSAKYEALTLENIQNHLMNTLQRDRTGMITNFAIRAREVSNHLRQVIKAANENGMDKVNFIHPREFGKAKEWGFSFKPGMYNGTYCCRGLVEMKNGTPENGFEVQYDDANGIFGVKTLDEIREYVEKFDNKNLYLRDAVMFEIDGAKTGINADGPDGNMLPNTVKVRVTSDAMFTSMQCRGRIANLKGRDGKRYIQKDKNALNQYKSLSPWSQLKNRVIENGKPIMDQLVNNTGRKIAFFEMLLDEQENAAKNAMMNEVIEIRKEFNNTIKELPVDIEPETRMQKIAELRDKAKDTLESLTGKYNTSEEAVAVSAYKAAYDRKSDDTGLTFGWILIAQLMSVAKRADSRTMLMKLPKSTKTAEVKNGTLFVNGEAKKLVKAYDGPVAIRSINGDICGIIHRKSVNATGLQKRECINVGATYMISLMGQRFCFEGVADPVKRSLELLIEASNEVLTYARSQQAAGQKVDVNAVHSRITTGLDEKGNLTLFVSGRAIGRIKIPGADQSHIVNREVVFVNSSEMSVTSGSINKMKMRVWNSVSE